MRPLNESESNEIEVVIAEIRSAFHGVPRGEISIHQAMSIDVFGSEKWMEQARSLDKETNWEDVPDDYIPKCENSLSHLDPKSWRYYLPCYMIWALRNFRTSNSFVIDSTVYSLTLPKEEDLKEYHLKRYHTLSRDQSMAVRKFLELMSKGWGFVDAYVAGIALRKHWSQF